MLLNAANTKSFVDLVNNSRELTAGEFQGRPGRLISLSKIIKIIAMK